MDCGKIGELIGHLRKERGLTQRALAEKLSVTDKAVSKWERGLGCPDVSLLTDLSAALGVDMAALLTGELPSEDESGGNMKNAKYFVCPTCGGITMTTGEGQLTCCGRPWPPWRPRRPRPRRSSRWRRSRTSGSSLRTTP